MVTRLIPANSKEFKSEACQQAYDEEVGRLRGIKCWLDVDNMRTKAGTSATDKESFTRLIDEQHTIIALLTGSLNTEGSAVSDYFRSVPCLSECKRAFHNGIPVIFLRETDPTQ